MIKAALKKILPESVENRLRKARHDRVKARRKQLSPLSEELFATILTEDLGLVAGDVVFVHSSTGRLSPAFDITRLLGILEDILGPGGTMVFPTYAQTKSLEFLRNGEVFDLRNSPSFMGLLSETVRRDPRAYRSLHPTKSVCAIGRHAKELTNSHQLSRYPYDEHSPYFKIMAHGGKVIGLGISTVSLSFVHCVDDALGAEFPAKPYNEKLFAGTCIDGDGNTVTVETFAHDMPEREMIRMVNNVPRLLARHVPPKIARDVHVYGRDFFVVHARELFERLITLARDGITIYPKSLYR